MNIPQKVKDLFDRTSLVAFGTADLDGTPNVNVVFWKKIINDETVLLIDNFFKTTKQNLQCNNKICLSFWDPVTEEGYKIKGKAQYHTQGDIFDIGKSFIQTKNPSRTPNGVVEIQVTEIFIITPGILAGEKLAE